MRMRSAWVALPVLLLFSPREVAAQVPEGVEGALREATVSVGSWCSGTLVDGPDLVLTAEHCVRDHTSVEIRFAGGATRTGWVAAIDHVADQALLLLEDPVILKPLRLTPSAPIVGSVVFFGGSPSQPRFQEARLQRVGTCPSLAQLPDAVFTTIDGHPGDSGAPIVDGAARVVGIVHGGSRCEIATPASTARRLIQRLLADEPVTHVPAAHPASPPASPAQ